MKSGSWRVVAACGKRARKARADGWNSGRAPLSGVHDALELQPGDLERIGLGRVGLVDQAAPGGSGHEALRVAREARGLDDQRGAIGGDGVGQEADDRLALDHDAESDEALTQQQAPESRVSPVSRLDDSFPEGSGGNGLVAGPPPRSRTKGRWTPNRVAPTNPRRGTVFLVAAGEWLRRRGWTPIPRSGIGERLPPTPPRPSGAKEWWRRRESNPRPKARLRETLQA